MEIMKLIPTGKDYLWGGTRLREEYGKKIDLTPLAETWECSVHPDGPSYVANGTYKGNTLADVLKAHPEYPWAPSYKCSEQYAEVEVDIETGEEETITENIPVPNYSKFMQFITKYSGEDGEESDGTITIPNVTYENKTVTRKVRKKIGNILHATTDLLWECQYDATIDETVTRSMPCAKIINTMHLKQLDREGFFYNSNHEIVAFDTNLTQDVNAVVIRKDVLDEFLAKTNMKLIWIMDAEKEVDRQSQDMVNWSEWEGVFVYEGDFVSGEFKRLK